MAVNHGKEPARRDKERQTCQFLCLRLFSGDGANHTLSPPPGKWKMNAVEYGVQDGIVRLVGRAELPLCPEFLGGSQFGIGTPYRRAEEIRARKMNGRPVPGGGHESKAES
jgi:hypothetical protein